MQKDKWLSQMVKVKLDSIDDNQNVRKSSFCIRGLLFRNVVRKIISLPWDKIHLFNLKHTKQTIKEIGRNAAMTLYPLLDNNTIINQVN